MTLTIGLPVYNAEKYVKDAITSIKNQNSKDWFCIITDDGSHDGSIDIIRRLIKDDSRFRLIADGKNLGLPSRLNQIASLCETKYLARMDSDDIMLPHRLSTQIGVLENCNAIDVVGSDAYIIGTDNKLYGIRNSQTNFNTQNAIQSSLFIHPTVVAKTSWFRANPYSVANKRSEDYELWLRTVRFSNFAKVDQPLLFYREVGLKHASKYDATMSEILKILSNHELRDNPVFRDQIAKVIIDVKRKKEVFKLISSLGLEKLLIKRRSDALSEDQRNEAELAMKEALVDTVVLDVENNVSYGAIK